MDMDHKLTYKNGIMYLDDNMLSPNEQFNYNFFNCMKKNISPNPNDRLTLMETLDMLLHTYDGIEPKSFFNNLCLNISNCYAQFDDKHKLDNLLKDSYPPILRQIIDQYRPKIMNGGYYYKQKYLLTKKRFNALTFMK